MNIFMDADAAADVLGQTTSQAWSTPSAVTSKVGLSRHLGSRHLGTVPNCRLPELSPLHQNGAD